MENKRSYYAIIPATVRYDKGLPAGAKLLYGEITALCNQEGFCWANNSYFAELYDVSDKTVRRWVQALEDRGYIVKNIEYEEDGKTVIRRCLSLPDVPRWGQKCPEPPGQKCPNPPDKNVRYNNTDRIIQENNIESPPDNSKAAPCPRFVKPSVEEIKSYIAEMGYSIDAQRFYDYYESNGWMVGRNRMRNWKAAVRTWGCKERSPVRRRVKEIEIPDDFD